MPDTENGEREPLLRRNHGFPENSVNNISKGTFAWILFGLWGAVFLGALDLTIVATLVSPISSHFQQSHKGTYLGTSYLLSISCFTPLYGKLSDILGRKGAMQLGLALFTGGTFLCGIAPSMDTLILARAIAGMGGGGIVVVGSVTQTDLIPLKQRGLYYGLSTILFGIGSGIGGPFGGWINDMLGWRWAFLIQIPFLLMIMIVVALKLNVEHPHRIQAQSTYEKFRQIDWLGSFTLICAIGCLLLGVSLKTAEDITWSNPLIWGLLVGSGVSSVLFVIVEVYWSVAPVVPMRLLAQRTPMTIALVNLFASSNNFTMLYNIPLYFSTVLQTTPSEAGLHLTPNSVAIALGSFFAGWVMQRTGKFYYLTLASALLIMISSILIAMWNENTPEIDLWFDIVPSGLGISSLFTTLLIALIASVSRDDMAVATGLTFLCRTTGQVLGVTLAGALVQARLLSQLREHITGPGSEEIIQRIRHETDYISSLDPPLRKIAMDSYASALRAVFVGQICIAVCIFLACLPIEENPLANSHEEQDAQDRRRQANLASASRGHTETH